MPRPNAPWWRTDRRQWFATVRGKKMPLGVFDPKDEAGAVRALRRLLGLPDTSEPVPPTVRLACEVRRYEREVVAHMGGQTQPSYLSRLRWLVARFGGQAVADLSAAEVETAARGMGWSDNTRRLTLLVVQGFVRWAGRKDFYLKKPPATSRGDDCLVSPDVFARLLDHARGDMRAYLLVLWATGARPGEVCGLTAEGVDWVNGVAVLKRHKTAAKGKRRVLFLSEEALAVLADQKKRHPTGPLFVGRSNRPFCPRSAKEKFRRLTRLAGVPSLTLYCFRHTYITRKLEEGKPESDVAALVGHTGTAVIARVYSHVTANARRLRGIA